MDAAGIGGAACLPSACSRVGRRQGTAGKPYNHRRLHASVVGNGGSCSGTGALTPCGFSRYFVLELLSAEGPLTGKEIIGRAAERSGNMRRPSPGLVYPLLGRLLEDGLVLRDGDRSGAPGGGDGGGDGKGGRYSVTERGRTTAADARKLADAMRTQIRVIARVAGAGRFLAADMLDRLSYAFSPVCTDLSRMTDGEAQSYRVFLESELSRVDAEIAGRRGSEIPVARRDRDAEDTA